jgi:hypothetical protein
MMYPRLQILRQFLQEDGAIFVSIGDDEFPRLSLLMSEVFDSRNRLGTLVWKRRSSSAMRGTPLSIDHEYLVAFAKDADKVTLHGLAKGEADYPYVDGDGCRYASTDLTIGMGRDERPGQFYDIVNPRTGKIYAANPDRVWRFWPETMAKVIADDLVIWPDEVGGRMSRPRYKTYFDPNTEKPKPISSWIERDNANDREIEDDEDDFDITILRSGMNQEGGKILQDVLGGKSFPYPKPLSLVRSLIRASTRENEITLDTFCGSGTTGHAVLDLNREDGGNRRFILIEMEPTVCRDVTAQRLAKVAEQAETPSESEGFRFCTLSEPLFDEAGQIRSQVTFSDLAAHVFFTETGEPIPKKATGKSPLIGECHGIAYYLLFNGVLGDKRTKGGNVLTAGVLETLPPHDGLRVVYGEGTRAAAPRGDRVQAGAV